MGEQTAEIIFIILGVTLVTFEFLWVRTRLELQKLKRELKTMNQESKERV